MENVRFITDEVGNKVRSTDYDVFGNWRSAVGQSNIHMLFQGQQQDPEISLYYLRARYYDPTTGRFISRDPVEGKTMLPQTQNPYAYSLNNPVNLSDPSGEQVAQLIQMCLRAGSAVAGRIGSAISSIASKNPAATQAVQSTGRTAATNLTEQLAIEQVMANPTKGELLKNVIMKDPRWPASDGWVKMQETVNSITIHWNRNTQTGATADFKIVNPY